jgi:chromosome partitioning protein
MSKVIAFYNVRKGVGKTFLSYLFGASLAYKNVLLIDMNPQDDLTNMLLNERDLKFVGGLNSGMIFSDKDFLYNDIVFDSKIEGLKIIPAHLSLVKHEIPQFEQSDSRLKMFIERHYNEFDYILIDGPSTLGNLAYNIIQASDSIVIPVKPEMQADIGIILTYNVINRYTNKDVVCVMNKVNGENERYAKDLNAKYGRVFIDEVVYDMEEDLKEWKRKGMKDYVLLSSKNFTIINGVLNRKVFV